MNSVFYFETREEKVMFVGVRVVRGRKLVHLHSWLPGNGSMFANLLQGLNPKKEDSNVKKEKAVSFRTFQSRVVSCF